MIPRLGAASYIISYFSRHTFTPSEIDFVVEVDGH